MSTLRATSWRKELQGHIEAPSLWTTQLTMEGDAECLIKTYLSNKFILGDL